MHDVESSPVPSKAVIVLCEKDLPQAELLVNTWVRAGNNKGDLIQLSTDGTLMPDIAAIVPQGIPQSHPEAPNQAFKHLLNAAYQSFNFLFLESDCVIHPERGKRCLWHCDVQLEYLGGKVLGAPIHVPKHGWTHNGVAYYMHDLKDYLDLSEMPPDVPFDDWIAPQLYSRRLLAPSNLVCHSPKGGIKDVVLADKAFPYGAIHHGCKDKSLGELLLESKSDTVPA